MPPATEGKDISSHREQESLSLISIVGQDVNRLEDLAGDLRQSGYQCSVFCDRPSPIASVVQQSPDVILLENDSYYRIAELSSEIKQTCFIPVVAIVGVDLIGRVDRHFDNIDDFVAKPFRTDELQLRIERLLRRGSAEGEEVIRCGELKIDTAKCEVFVGERMVILTFREYELLKFLVANRNRVCERDSLLNKVWGFDYFGGDRTVDVHIRRLRSKIEDPTHTFINTVRNIGYRFRAES